MQLNLPNSGTFFFISDHCHVIENASSFSQFAPAIYLTFNSGETVSPKDGWHGKSSLLNSFQASADSNSDHPAWFQSTQRLKRLESTTKGRVIPGHDKETFLQLQSEIKGYLS